MTTNAISSAQDFWPQGKACAVSLTYDDAFESHWREVAPALEERGFRGTFYTPIRASLWNHAEEWRAVAAAGHELGNHSVFHPCRRAVETPAYQAIDRHDLSRYTLDEFRQELEVANAYLRLLDGRSSRSYGNTCHHITVGRDAEEESISPVLRQLFPAARGARRQDGNPSDPRALDLYEIGCVSSPTFEALGQSILEALDTGGWLIICLHDVADRVGRLQMARSEHTALLDFLSGQSTVWIAPVLEIAEQIRMTRSLETKLTS